ncbi:MAG TPA: septal ring lytic transglycosylase RlpA family protein [Solirubrobacterales bacterium]|nr:septal ring lytic transglycosylase RlpA family protein [Solirubrobacterales bacterium]
MGLVFAVPAGAVTGGAATTAAAPETVLPGSGGLVFGPMRRAGATWYGPTLYGNSTACGQVLRPKTVGVAHRTLPCGTAVKFVYEGRVLVTRVIDRGPYSKGKAWDLTNGAREILGFEGVDKVGYAIATSYTRSPQP